MVYTVHDQSEETVCDWCGAPICIGEKVYTDEAERYVFCAPQDQRAYMRDVAGRWPNAEYLEPIRMSGAILDEFI